MKVNIDGSFAYTPRADLDRGLQFGESFQYQIRDEVGHVSDVATVTIVIQALEAPQITGDSLSPVSENSAGAVVGQVQATDPEGTDSLIYTVDDPRFEFVGNSLQLKDTEALDFEIERSVSLSVQVSDGNGLSDSQSFIVDVLDVDDEAPTFVDVPTLSVSEGATLPLDNTVLQVNDVDTADADVTFVIRDQSGGVVWADGNALDLQDTFTLEQLKNEAVEYRHAGAERSSGESYIELGVRDQQSELISIPRIGIEVIPVNNNDPVAQDQLATGKHNTTTNMVVTADGGMASTLLHGVIDADLPDDSFSVIVNNTAMQFGTLTVNDDGSFAYTPRADLDRDMQFEESFQYQIVDAANHVSDAATVTIVIQALEAPQITGDSLSPVSENDAGAVVGQVQATNPEGADSLIYSVDDPRFEFVGDTLKLKDSEALDFEIESSVSLIVQASDGNGLSDSQTVIVDVLDENDAPQVDQPLGEQELDESSVVALDVNTFTDQDNDPLRYSLARENGQALPEWIVFDTDTNELSLGVAPAEISTAQLRLSVEDGRGGTAQMVFIVRYFPEMEELPDTSAPEGIDNGIVEPSLGEASSFDETLFEVSDTDVEFVTPTALAALQTPDSSASAVSDAAFSELDEGRLEEDGSDVVASLAVNTLLSVFDNNETVGVQAQAQRDNVLTEQLASRRQDLSKSLQLRAAPDLFDQSINIAELFASAQAQDSGMYASLTQDFEKRQLDSEETTAASRAVVGSSLALTTGVSIGYFLYLLRGGAIMASMLTSLPAWRFVDPLPILTSLDDSDGVDSESLQSIVSGEK